MLIELKIFAPDRQDESVSFNPAHITTLKRIILYKNEYKEYIYGTMLKTVDQQTYFVYQSVEEIKTLSGQHLSLDATGEFPIKSWLDLFAILCQIGIDKLEGPIAVFNEENPIMFVTSVDIAREDIVETDNAFEEKSIAYAGNQDEDFYYPVMFPKGTPMLNIISRQQFYNDGKGKDRQTDSEQDQPGSSD